MNTMTAPLDGLQAHVQPHVTAALQRAGTDAWIPEGEGKWSLPLHFLAGGAGVGSS
jgi:2,4'-dihydroxyacetophenone dioxygenase